MNETMKRFESRYIDVKGFKVKFTWCSKSSDLMKVSVLKEVDGIFGKRYKKVYSDTFYTYTALSYKHVAERTVQSYLYDIAKWKLSYE